MRWSEQDEDEARNQPTPSTENSRHGRSSLLFSPSPSLRCRLQSSSQVGNYPESDRCIQRGICPQVLDARRRNSFEGFLGFAENPTCGWLGR